MLVTSTRTPMMGPLASPTDTSPGSHHIKHHHMNHLDDDHHPADLSPHSSNSSLISSSESLLNTSLNVPSPTPAVSSADQRGQRRASCGSSGAEDGGPGTIQQSINANNSTGTEEDNMNALQHLRNAFERSPYSAYFHHDPHNNQGSDNEQMEQHISKSFAILGSPVVPSHHHHLLNSPTNLSVKSGEESDDDARYGHAMEFVRHGQHSPQGVQTIVNGIAAVIFQCPLCAVVCNSRHDFNEHLVTHSSENRPCPKCPFTANNDDELREHVQEAHGTDDIDMLSDDEEVKTPKTNAQGKLKTFKCKQCEYTAVTKKEFWDHNKTHIRSEKMLHCPKCPFVTEYKHHLEYHLRNHMGSKPYQCTKCNYSCVNKSMLNSHLKSHSNVYQYRCSDCSYATKYCHSLKLHLRKYNHNPAMVLNPDGTPNPLPIIDVYGTRRGPKMKRPDPILEGLATTNPILGSPKVAKKKSTPVKKDKTDKAQQKLHQQQILDAHDLSPKPASSPRYISSMPNQSSTPPLKKLKEDHSSGDSDSEIRMPNAHHPGKVTQLPQAPISPSSIALILQRSNGTNGELAQRKEMGYSHPPTSPNPLEIYSAALNQYLLNPMFHVPNAASLNELLAAQQLANEQKTKLLAQLLQSGIVPTTQQQQNVSSDMKTTTVTTAPAIFATNGIALDLSRMTIPVKSTVEEGKKRKRKGKAHRYERRSSSDDEDKVMRGSAMEEEALDFSNNNNNSSEYKDKNKRKSLLNKQEIATDYSFSSPPPNQTMMCKYCEISFPGRELYTIHMNYHSGDMDPFLCKSCGKKTRDKVEFFRHLTTDPH